MTKMTLLYSSCLHEITCKKNSIFRELGDFLAHPDQKDKGIVISSFQPVIDFFENNVERFFSDGIVNFEMPKGLGLLEDVQDSLFSEFKLVDLELPIMGRNEESFRDFIFCLIFILGSCKLKIKDKKYNLCITYGHSLQLNISYESSKKPRNFILMSVLFLGNVWRQGGSYEKELLNHIARRFDNGLLGAIPYELDFLNFNSNMSSYKKGVVWPLLNYR